LEGLAIENVGIFYGHLVYFKAVWSILWPFGIFYDHLIYFMAIWYIFPVLVCCIKKNLATLRAVLKNFLPQTLPSGERKGFLNKLCFFRFRAGLPDFSCRTCQNENNIQK
jgi:hypothetical protein